MRKGAVRISILCFLLLCQDVNSARGLPFVILSPRPCGDWVRHGSSSGTFEAPQIANRSFLKCRTALSSNAGQLIVPMPYSRRIFYWSLFIALTSFIAWLHRRYVCAFLGLGCCIFSLNHWRDPRNGPRRRLDIIMASSVLAYHFGTAVGVWGQPGPSCESRTLLFPPLRPTFLIGPGLPALGPLGYSLSLLLALLCYLRARYLARRRAFAKSTCWHMAFHGLAQLGIVMLYGGLPTS